MLCLDKKEASRFRLLIILPIVLGIASLMLPQQAMQLKDAWPDGPATIETTIDEHGKIVFADLVEFHSKKPDHVIINEATHADLVVCPGISSKTAHLILTERKFKQFYDWRDLQDRIKGLGPAKIRKLQEAGVKLSRDFKEKR